MIVNDYIAWIIFLCIIAFVVYLLIRPLPRKSSKTIIEDKTPITVKQDYFFKRKFKGQLIELLTAEIYISDDYYCSILWRPLRPDITNVEYIRFALHYFEKMIFNYDQNDKDMRFAAEIQRMSLQKILLTPLTKNSNLLLVAEISDTVKLSSRPKDNSSVIVGTLYYASETMRHITTTLPPEITTQKGVFSVIVLLQGVLKILNNSEIEILDKALRYMNNKYSSGYKYWEPQALALPNEAYISAIMGK